MSRWLWGWALLASTAQAAEITRINSTGETGDLFDATLSVGYAHTHQQELITREQHVGGDVRDVGELRYRSTDNRMNIDLRLGLWRDLEFRYNLPVVISQNRHWRYPNGRSAANSSITNNCLNPDGSLTNPACTSTGVGREPMFAIPSDSYRRGFGNMSFGLAHAIFNQAKDVTKPTWLAGLDYEAPTANVLDPYVSTSSSARGGIGDKTHKLKLHTELSRRMGAADPYFQLQYMLPFRASGFYSNCDHPDAAVLGTPGNCGGPGWPRTETGLRPPHQLGVVLGTELYAYDDPKRERKVAFDVRGFASYISRGRYYNELSDVLQRLLYTQDYLNLGASVGLVVRPISYVQLNARLGLSHNTDHTLTDETVGKDLDGNGTVDVLATPSEVNPNFDFRSDMVSRRFRAVGTNLVSFELSATVAF